MSIVACPTDVIAAPAERIWELLVDTSNLAQWTGTRLLEGPQRTLQAGDKVVYGAGPGLRAVFHLTSASRQAGGPSCSSGCWDRAS
jgi:hypothetical protein